MEQDEIRIRLFRTLKLLLVMMQGLNELDLVDLLAHPQVWKIWARAGMLFTVFSDRKDINLVLPLAHARELCDNMVELLQRAELIPDPPQDRDGIPLARGLEFDLAGLAQLLITEQRNGGFDRDVLVKALKNVDDEILRRMFDPSRN